MAQEWYLMSSHTRPNSLGGFENDSFNDFKDDAFDEALMTDIATTVTLYNYDLSQSVETRCIVQGNISDSQDKSAMRTVLFKRGTIKTGMYVYFENRYWLVDGYPGNNGIFEKATMVLCQYKLRWQNAAGEIIERWCNETSTSKYGIGEDGNSVLLLSSNTFLLKMPDDKETLELDGKRVFIDKHKTNPTKVFRITKTDDTLYDFGKEHGGIFSFIADKTEFNPTTDNQELRVCDYKDIHKTTTSINEMVVSIIGKERLQVGYPRTYSVTFTDKQGNAIDDISFAWNVLSDFDVEQSVKDNSITVNIQDDDLVGQSFSIHVLVNGSVITSKEISIVEDF